MTNPQVQKNRKVKKEEYILFSGVSKLEVGLCKSYFTSKQQHTER